MRRVQSFQLPFKWRKSALLLNSIHFLFSFILFLFPSLSFLFSSLSLSSFFISFQFSGRELKWKEGEKSMSRKWEKKKTKKLERRKREDGERWEKSRRGNSRVVERCGWMSSTFSLFPFSVLSISLSRRSRPEEPKYQRKSKWSVRDESVCLSLSNSGKKNGGRERGRKEGERKDSGEKGRRK